MGIDAISTKGIMYGGFVGSTAIVSHCVPETPRESLLD